MILLVKVTSSYKSLVVLWSYILIHVPDGVDVILTPYEEVSFDGQIKYLQKDFLLQTKNC